MQKVTPLFLIIKDHLAVFFTLVLFAGLATQTTLAAPADDFVTTWKTDNPGTSNDTSITVSMVGGPYDVDWNNDGVSDEFALSDSVTHDFGSTGTYTIRVRGVYDSFRAGIDGDQEKILSVDQWGTNPWWTMDSAFRGASNLTIPATDTPNSSAVTDMSRMFEGATSANPNTSNWDTSSVTDMSWMFWGATSANPDTSGWDTSSVTDMALMFDSAFSANPDTSGWDTSSVIDMALMFGRAISANPDTSNWDTSSVTYMSGIFAFATSANPDTSSWDTSSVTDMDLMFSSTNSANPDTSNWNTSAVENMKGMFAGNTSANPDTSSWDTSSVTDMRWMFWDATSANPDTSGWDTSSVTNMNNMFTSATSFDRDIGSWNVTSLLEASEMFRDTQLSISNYDNLLIGWSAQTLQPGVSFSGGNSTYCSKDAFEARASMITTYSWVITDGGACPPIFKDGFEAK